MLLLCVVKAFRGGNDGLALVVVSYRNTHTMPVALRFTYIKCSFLALFNHPQPFALIRIRVSLERDIFASCRGSSGLLLLWLCGWALVHWRSSEPLSAGFQHIAPISSSNDPSTEGGSRE